MIFTSTIRARLRSTRGAIDLASILVGVLLIGIVSATVAATTFTAIPWSQDHAARQSLDAVHLAQSLARVTDSNYLDGAALAAQEYLPASDTIRIETDAAGTCYTAAGVSASGKTFWTDSGVHDVVEYQDGISESSCADLAAVVAAIGAPAPGSDPTPVVPASSFTMVYISTADGTPREGALTEAGGIVSLTEVAFPMTWELRLDAPATRDLEGVYFTDNSGSVCVIPTGETVCVFNVGTYGDWAPSVMTLGAAVYYIDANDEIVELSRKTFQISIN